MIKYTNPFHTINESIEILKKLGADPFADERIHSGATYPFPWGGSNETPIYWQDYVMHITVDLHYENGSQYFTLDIHMDDVGFDKLCSLMKPSEIIKEDYTCEYDIVYFRPDPLFRIFKLVPSEESK